MSTHLGTCRLCQMPNVELRDSHVVPAWAYDRLRKQMELDPRSKNKNPLLVTNSNIAVQTSKEVKEHLLCESCEQKFGIRENWFKQQIELLPNGLPAFSSLLGTRIRINDNFTLADVGTLDIDSLTYFALSVFWRASAAVGVELNLKPDAAEAIREYLYSGQFLPTSLSLQVCYFEEVYTKRPGLISAFNIPHTGDDGSHMFHIAGMMFNLDEACKAPDQHLCMLHGVGVNLIVTSGHLMVDPMLERAAIVQPRGTFRSYMDARGIRRP